MKKILYTIPDSNSVCIVTPVEKHSIEKVLGPLTDEQYYQHVYERSIPKGAIKVRELNEIDIPESREFRNAWIDKSDLSRIDICCTKAKELKLQELRLNRNKLLEESDIEMTRALEAEDSFKIQELKEKRQKLRDITEPLKALDTKDKLNDDDLLKQIKQLAKI